MSLKMNSPPSESELIRAAQRGDRSAFDELSATYRPRLAGLVRDRLGELPRQRVEVDDVLQETFLRAFRSFDRFTSSGRDSLFRWLSGIAVNIIREESKRAGRSPAAQTSMESPNQDASGLTTLRREERFHRLEEALERLPVDYRRVIQLTRIEKLPPDEVARRMNRSRQAVRNLLLRALGALKDSFGDTESLHLPPRSLKYGEAQDGE